MAKSYIITLKQDASDEQAQAIKDDIKNMGGSITQEYTLIKGFACELPDDHIQTFAAHPHVEGVEQDQEMKTQ